MLPSSQENLEFTRCSAEYRGLEGHCSVDWIINVLFLYYVNLSSAVLGCELFLHSCLTEGRKSVQHNFLSTQMFLVCIKWLSNLGSFSFTYICGFNKSAWIPNWICLLKQCNWPVQSWNSYIYIYKCVYIYIYLPP